VVTGNFMTKQNVRRLKSTLRRAGRVVRAESKIVKRMGAKVKGAKGRAGKPRGLFEGVGRAVGRFFGGAQGRTFGGNLGKGVSRYVGFGDYGLIGGGQNNPTLAGPNFAGNGRVIVSHREYLSDVVGSTAWSVSSYSVNPGLAATFPWFSKLASNFEQYRLLGCVFEYRTTSANALNSTNTALGTVIMAADYDSLDNAFQNKQQMEAYEGAVSTAPSYSAACGIECKSNQTTLTKQYVRVGAIPSGADIRMYDMANFQIATVGMQAAATIGELWVSYRVELLKPKLATPVGQQLPAARFTFAATSNNSFVLSTVVASATNVLAISITANAVTLAANQPGRYIIWYTVDAGTSYTSGGSLTLTNLSSVGSFPSSTGSSSTSQFTAGNTTTSFVQAGCAEVTNPASVATWTFGLPTIVGTCYGNLNVMQIPSGSNMLDVKALQLKFDDLNLQYDKLKKMIALAQDGAGERKMEARAAESTCEIITSNPRVLKMLRVCECGPFVLNRSGTEDPYTVYTYGGFCDAVNRVLSVSGDEGAIKFLLNAFPTDDPQAVPTAVGKPHIFEGDAKMRLGLTRFERGRV
jgi:hypothetical protein